MFNDSTLTNLCPTSLKRVISTPRHLAYVRISDGCNNRCAYCAIPLIRGNFKSRPKEEILEEIKYLARTKRKEICLISQDLTKYGIDINYSLEALLEEIISLKLDVKIRLLYLYPDEISDKLISIIKNNKMILPYFDIPIQHASNKLLKWMNRRGDQELIRTLINNIFGTLNTKFNFDKKTIIYFILHSSDCLFEHFYNIFLLLFIKSLLKLFQSLLHQKKKKKT